MRIPKALLKQLYYGEGLSQSKIAERLGCSEWVIRSHMAKYGMQTRVPGEYRRWDIPEDFLRRLYYEEQLSQKKIAEQIGCDDGVIRHRMREFGMTPRTPGDYKRLPIPEHLLRKWYCCDELSLMQIAERLGCSQTAVLRRLKKYGIDRRPRGDTPHYSVPGEVLKTWTPDLAYVVGLITADGNLARNNPAVKLASTDREMIETYQRILRTNAPIRVTHLKKGRKELYRLRISDRSFRHFLEGVGLMPAKAKRLGVLNIPDAVFRDFLRGCMDGDGSVYIAVYKQAVYKNGDRRLMIARLSSSSFAFLEWVRDTVARLTGLRCNINENKQGFYSLSYNGKKAIALLHWIYYAPNLPCLTRKRAAFERYLRGER